MEEKLLTIRDVAILLNVSEKEVMDMAESGKVPAYKIGGVYLRFKRDQVEEFRRSSSSLKARPASQRYPFMERVSDFFYFNDFYILVVLLVALMIFVIFRGH